MIKNLFFDLDFGCVGPNLKTLGTRFSCKVMYFSWNTMQTTKSDGGGRGAATA